MLVLRPPSLNAKLLPMMRSGVLIFVIATTATSASAYCAGADITPPSYRPDYYSVPLEFSRSKYVIEGIVENERWLGDDGEPKPLISPFGPGDKRPWGIAAPYMGAWYDVEVVRSFKGNPPKHLHLFSENSTARFWLNKGERYLLFVDPDTFDPPIRHAFSIDTCGNSAKFSRALASRIEHESARH